MAIKQRTLVVVPCYNEAQRLAPEAFHAALQAEPRLEFVFVDDGSTDDTFGVLRELARYEPRRLHVLKLDQNSGKAEAVRRGVVRAIELGAELVGYWDADLATPLLYVARFAERLEDPTTEMVFGSRVRLLGRRVERSVARHYVGRGFATVAGLALKLPIYDTQCGAKLFRADDIFREVFSRPFELSWCFDVEVFARLLGFAERGKLRIEEQCIEYPLDAWADARGSKLTVRHFPGILREILALVSITRRARRASPEEP